jgi:hypothetical protein
MAGILKVDKYQDFNGNDIMTSDGAGNVTVNAAAMKNTPAFYVTQTSAQSLANNTATTLTFGTTVYDTDSSMSSTTFTVPSGGAGTYYFYARYRVNTATDSTRLACDIKVNGTSIASYNNDQNDENSSSVSGSAVLSVGDAVIVVTFQTTGGAVDTKNGVNTAFGGYKLIT